MLLIGPKNNAQVPQNHVDNRLVGLQDVMPTLLSLSGLPIPNTVEGMSMVGAKTRAFLYGECKENESATRMVHDGRHKLIWYPAGNHLQLFDLEKDPSELLNLHGSEPYAEVESKLIDLLVGNAWGTDCQWIRDGKLVGFPFVPSPPAGDRHFGGQRGLHYPQPPLDDPARSVGSPG